jgi:hypothetical protein
LRQTETAPYRHLQPVAMEWYARMLLQRNESSDGEKARALLDEAIARYQSLGLPFRALHAREARALL